MDVRECRSPFAARPYLTRDQYRQESTHFTAQQVGRLVAQV